MSFAGLLRHSCTIVRQEAVLAMGEPTYTELGQPITADSTVGTWPCLIQPRTARELALLSQAGAVIGDFRIFGPTADLLEGDRLEAADGRTFEVMAIENAAGQDHHLEVEARRVGSEDVALPS